MSPRLPPEIWTLSSIVAADDPRSSSILCLKACAQTGHALLQISRQHLCRHIHLDNPLKRRVFISLTIRDSHPSDDRPRHLSPLAVVLEIPRIASYVRILQSPFVVLCSELGWTTQAHHMPTFCWTLYFKKGVCTSCAWMQANAHGQMLTTPLDFYLNLDES